MKKIKVLSLVAVILISALCPIGITNSQGVKFVAVIDSEHQGYVVFGVFDNGVLKTQATQGGESRKYDFEGDIIDYDVFKSNFYLATPTELYVIPVTENPLKSDVETKIWEASGNVEIISLSTTPGPEMNEVFVVFALTNKTVISYYYDVSKNPKNPISVDVIAEGVQESINTKPSFNIELVAFGGGEFVYVFKQGDSENAIWNHQFTSEIKQVKIHDNHLIIRTLNKIDIYDINDIKNEIEAGSEYTSSVMPKSPFIIYEDKLYYEYQEGNEWDLLELDVGTWNENIHDAALSGSMENLGFEAGDDVLYAVTMGPSIYAFELYPYDEKWETTLTGKHPTTRPAIGIMDGTTSIYVGLSTIDEPDIGSVYTISESGTLGSVLIPGEPTTPVDEDGDHPTPKPWWTSMNPVTILVLAVIVIAAVAGYLTLKDRMGRPKEDEMEDLKDLL